MTYLSGKANTRKKYIRYGIFVVIFCLVLLLWPFIRKNLYGVIEPAAISYGGAKQSFAIFPEFFKTYLTTHQSLVKKENELVLEIERLENELAEKNALLRENNVEASSTDSVYTRRPLVVYPLMQDVTRIYGGVLLSKGFKDGIAIGSMVYLRGNQVVCSIKKVYDSSSLCLLLSSSGVTTEGVTSSSSIVLSLVGRGGHFLADVVRDAPVEVGEIVYLRSDPRMILGTVREVVHNNQDTSWHVFIEGAYNPVTASTFYVQQ